MASSPWLRALKDNLELLWNDVEDLHSFSSPQILSLSRFHGTGCSPCDWYEIWQIFICIQHAAVTVSKAHGHAYRSLPSSGKVMNLGFRATAKASTPRKRNPSTNVIGDLHISTLSENGRMTAGRRYGISNALLETFSARNVYNNASCDGSFFFLPVTLSLLPFHLVVLHYIRHISTWTASLQHKPMSSSRE